MDYKVTDTELTNVANAIRAKGGTSAPLTWESGFASAISAIPTGITPSGTLSIGANGDYDVTNYASASVSVPGLVPSGTYSITNNGIYDIVSYASVDVNVSGGGGDDKFKQYVEGTLSQAVDDTVSIIRRFAFASMSTITLASFTHATVLGSSTFLNCSQISEAYFPLCISIYNSAFYNCSNLKSVSFTSAEMIDNNAFRGCSQLITTSFPNVSRVYSSAFAGCSALSTLSFPKATSIYTSAFSGCYRLLNLYLMGSSFVTLGESNALNSTPIAGYTTQTSGAYGSIYVKSSLYNSYLSATNWSVYASRFVSV